MDPERLAAAARLGRKGREMLEGRDSLEKVRVVSSKVLGRAVRVCAKLESVAAAAASAASMALIKPVALD